jgi:hypothetical protein
MDYLHLLEVHIPIPPPKKIDRQAAGPLYLVSVTSGGLVGRLRKKRVGFAAP